MRGAAPTRCEGGPGPPSPPAPRMGPPRLAPVGPPWTPFSSNPLTREGGNRRFQMSLVGSDGRVDRRNPDQAAGQLDDGGGGDGLDGHESQHGRTRARALAGWPASQAAVSIESQAIDPRPFRRFHRDAGPAM